MKVNNVLRDVKGYRCPECGWHRDLTLNLKDQKMLIDHVIYGKVSVAELAAIDAVNHECVFHRIAVEKVKGVLVNA